MEDSMTVNFAYHANSPSVGLSLHLEHAYKMLVCDTGLFIPLAFWDKSVTENVIYQKLLSDKLSADLGYVYEKLWSIEVKSSGYANHKSLDEFCKKYSQWVSERILIYIKDLRKDQETLLSTAFMMPFL